MLRYIRPSFTIAMLGLFFGVAVGPSRADSPKELLNKLVPKLATKLAKKAQGRKDFRVAVFPFGNSKARVISSTASLQLSLQGEIINRLQVQSDTRFFVLDSAGLYRVFKNKSVDPSSVTTANHKQTAKILQKIQVDAAILGSFDRESFVRAGGKNLVDKVNLSLTIVFADTTFDQLPGDFDPGEYPDPREYPPSDHRRFGVEILLNGVRQQLYKSTDSEHHNVFFLKFKRKLLQLPDEQREYSIKIFNNGDNLAAAAVLVDGVNSIFQRNPHAKKGSGRMRTGLRGSLVNNGQQLLPYSPDDRLPRVLLPEYCDKWVLTPRGYAFVKDRKRPGKCKLYKLRPGDKLEDGSVMNIPGFQENVKTALAFTLTRADESIAETIGITNSVGLIEIHFYGASLKTEAAGAGINTPGVDVKNPNAGTRAGRPRPNDTCVVDVMVPSQPTEVWRIFYRFEGATDIPEKLTPLVRAAR